MSERYLRAHRSETRPCADVTTEAPEAADLPLPSAGVSEMLPSASFAKRGAGIDPEACTRFLLSDR